MKSPASCSFLNNCVSVSVWGERERERKRERFTSHGLLCFMDLPWKGGQPDKCFHLRLLQRWGCQPGPWSQLSAQNQAVLNTGEHQRSLHKPFEINLTSKILDLKNYLTGLVKRYRHNFAAEASPSTVEVCHWKGVVRPDVPSQQRGGACGWGL